MTDELLLLQLMDGPALVVCWGCDRPTLLGEYAAVLDLGPHGRTFLCASCTGQISPSLATTVEALNLIASTARDLTPAQSVRLVCSLVDQVARIAGPTLALLDVPSQLIERITTC